ncbi:hypothetical protein QAD02_023169 [Eretmocerus hayati]|uniref:Uncharacterized protein n=1 Tax=Eretmocerus hayati TaxID=131215 RepID=A0ACC2PZZ1_9HYME|nr:hypothetical protein QAD02_023169 [Eretmocerus hayati]
MSVNSESAVIDVNGAQNDEPNLCENLDTWMTRLPPRLRSLPITSLAIPGSHNTMTYTIERSNDVGPDEPVPIQRFARYFPILAKPLIFNWCVNQYESVKDQLDGGIRYLDLRVATKANDDKVYFLHGLYGAEITQPLQEVADWLTAHPNEVIVIDFQHFYAFADAHHRSLIDYVKYLFRGKLCPVYSKFDHISLQWLSSERYQVFIVYRNVAARNYNDLWPSGLWPTPWPNTVNADKLIDFLNDGLQKRSRNFGYVSQCLLTPSTSYIVKHICGSLKKDLSVKCRNVTLPWVKKNSPGSGGLNIVITDYISFDDFVFPRTVIQRNATLLGLQSYYNPHY